MMRMLGFVLLQTAAIVCAHRHVKEKRLANDALRDFCDMLDQLQGLLENDASPMPELLRKLSARCKGEARAFADALCDSTRDLGKRSFQELWQKVCLEKTTLAGKNAAQELEALGGILGRYDLDVQTEAVTTCKKALRHALDQRQDKQAQEAYTTVGLSLSASLLLGILLL